MVVLVQVEMKRFTADLARNISTRVPDAPTGQVDAIDNTKKSLQHPRFRTPCY